MTTKKRPEILVGKTHKIKIEGCATMYATLNKEEDALAEVILNVGKKGGCQNTCFYVSGVFLSILLELGVSKEKLVKTMKKHLIGVKCDAGESCWSKLGGVIVNEIEKEKAKA
jgi:hypothetical protein